MTDEKIKQTINNHKSYAIKYILDHKKDFSSFKTIYHRFIKKDNFDPSFEYTKEIIKRLERDKITSQTSMQMAEIIMPEVKGMRKEILIMAIPLFLGVLLLITFSLLLSFTRPLDFSNPFFIGYLVGVFISSILLGFGIFQRKKIKLSTLSTTMLFQAISAYSAAKMQGQGSFAAFRILEEMKNNPGKELQIRVNQPKIVYK